MKKRDLLLLHGALADKSQFDSLIPHLEDKFTTHTFNFDGHGNKPLKCRHFRIEHFVENVLNYMDEHRLSRADMFGYSMGGLVSLYLVYKFPQRAIRVFTLATKLQWTSEFAAKEGPFLNPETMKNKTPQFASALKGRHTAFGWKNVLDRTAEMFYNLGENALMSIADFQRIKNPVKLSLGDKDKMVSIEETLEIFRALPHGQLQIFPDTYHPFEKISLDSLSAAMVSFFYT